MILRLQHWVNVMYTHCGEAATLCRCGVFNAWWCRYKDFIILKLKRIFEWIACGYGFLNGLPLDIDIDMIWIWMWIRIWIWLWGVVKNYIISLLGSRLCYILYIKRCGLEIREWQILVSRFGKFLCIFDYKYKNKNTIAA